MADSKEVDLTTIDPNLADWLQRGAKHINANHCPKCNSQALTQIEQLVRCCYCNHQWQSHE